MARIRYIKPEAFTDEDMGSLPPVVRWFYTGLWTQADCEGILEDKPHELKLKLIPYDAETGEQCLSLLASCHKVIRYEAGAKRYLCIPTLKQHQKFHPGEKPRGFPPPPPAEDSSTTCQPPANHLPRTPQPPASNLPAGGQQVASNIETETETETLTGNGELRLPLRPAAAELVEHFPSVVPDPDEAERQLRGDEDGTFPPTGLGFCGWWNRYRELNGLTRETFNVAETAQWADRCLAELGPNKLFYAAAAYFHDDFWAPKFWPLAVFRSEGVWRIRANEPGPPRKSRRGAQ